jgi:glycosyltransferase involved in cell wall biosynthesis
MSTHTDLDFLKDVLVLTVHKGFWASPECEIFPNRIYSRTLFPGPGRWGSSRNPLNVLNVALCGYLYTLLRKPKLILFGAAPRVSSWFAQLKQNRLLPNVKMVAAGAMFLEDTQARQMDMLYIFSRNEVMLHDPALKDKFVFIPLAGPGDFTPGAPRANGEYIFSGGGGTRDFAALIEAIKGLDIEVVIGTFSPKSLRYDGPLPDNCTVYWNLPRHEFLEWMAHATFVAIPLVEGLSPHGHTTVVEALYLHKAQITTSNASVDDYVTHNQEGIMVPPGDVTGYREAIIKLLQDVEFRQACEANARIKAQELSYQAFGHNLAQICYQVLQT